MKKDYSTKGYLENQFTERGVGRNSKWYDVGNDLNRKRYSQLRTAIPFAICLGLAALVGTCDESKTSQTNTDNPNYKVSVNY